MQRRRTLPRAVLPRAVLLPSGPALAVVGLQIAYPLTHGTARDRLTVAIVVVLAATSVVHAAVSRGVRCAVLLLGVTAVPGFAVEVLGVHTGVPFGSYSYGTGLGTAVLGVPLVVGLAWTMLAWPAAVVARRLVPGVLARVLVGAWALASADLFLDPQLVAAGRWRWSTSSVHLPGVPSVPLTNYVGWLLVALVLSALVQTCVQLSATADVPVLDDAVAIGLYLWLYVGWIIALAAFLDLPAAAGWGALAMGVVALPLAARSRRWAR